MSVVTARMFGAASVLVVSSTGTWADITAQDVWSDWKAYTGGMGYEISASESYSGGVLTISDLVMRLDAPEGEATVGLRFDTMSMVENGDGSVNVNMPESFPVDFELRDDGEEIAGRIQFTQTAPSMHVSGTTSDMRYVYKTSRMGMELRDLTVDGEAIPSSIARLSAALTDVQTISQMQTGALRSYDQDVTASSLTYDFAFDDPESDDNGVLRGSAVGLKFAGQGKIPNDVDSSDMQAMLQAGFALDGTFSVESSTGSINGIGDGEPFEIESSSKDATVAIQMDQAHVAYDIKQNAVDLSMTVPDLPLPIFLSMAEIGFKLDMPIQKSDQEQPFAFGLRLGDFTMPDTLWGLFDPAAILPRDPATIFVDVTGKAKVLFDMMDPEAAEAIEDDAPGELNALTINELLISAVGAKLSGTGDFTFDNSDTQSFDGIPAPSGSASLHLAGANALLDRLIQMGIMSDSDAMGARMMMGMLAVPGDAPDTLKSNIEINDQGHIIANGQRIK
jgi:hypothetical protein